MVAMPYIIVNAVLSLVSLVLFAVTSAALLSRYAWANRQWPAPLRRHRALAFLAHALVFSLVVIALVVLIRTTDVSMLHASEVLFCIGLANSAVLIYQFLDGRCFRSAPKIPRRVAMAASAAVIACVGAIAMIGLVLRVFTIR